MKFLVDNAISPLVSAILKNNGYNTVHVRDYNMQQSPDEQIFHRAIAEERIIISTDADFGTLLSNTKLDKPSVILFRRFSKIPSAQANLLLANLTNIETELEKGCIAIIEHNRIRIRLLPLL